MDLPTADEQIIVAVSGGADSLALWLALDELRRRKKWRNEIVVAHFNHQLRPESAADAAWVAETAAQRGYLCIVGAGDVGTQAKAQGDNLEQAARRARYDFLQRVAETCQARYVLTAHTLDDQAETVLLNLARGSGLDGLGGMKPVRPLAANSKVWLVRPLLSWARRAETQAYCQTQNIVPRADAMNDDERFARVRVRRQLVPLLATLNPQAVTALGRTAELLREDADYLNTAARELLVTAQMITAQSVANTESTSDVSHTRVAPVCVAILADAPSALRLRALRLWLADARGNTRRLTAAHLHGVAQLLEGTQGGRVAELPNGGRVVRRRGWLWLEMMSDE